MTLRSRTINRRYRLERRISLSETSETWLGFDSVLHRAVAVSMPRQELLRNGSFLVEFLQRSRIATALHHRGIVAAFDSGEDNDLPYLVTEYLGGESLTEIIRAESPFDVDDVAILIDQLGSALDYAHQRGFVHGALSPTNIVVDDRGAAKLLGLGIPIGNSDPQTPPSSQSEYSIDDDISALGAIAFEMLTGEKPGEVELDAAGEAYLIDPDIPRNASDIVSIALGTTRTRFASAGAFARSFTGWRSFDPGEFFVPPDRPDEWEADELLFPPGLVRTPLAKDDPAPLLDDWLDDSIEQPRIQVDHTRWLLIAAFVLLIAAGVIAWQNSTSPVGAVAALPAQIEALAQLSGF